MRLWKYWTRFCLTHYDPVCFLYGMCDVSIVCVGMSFSGYMYEFQNNNEGNNFKFECMLVVRILLFIIYIHTSFKFESILELFIILYVCLLHELFFLVTLA